MYASFAMQNTKTDGNAAEQDLLNACRPLMIIVLNFKELLLYVFYLEERAYEKGPAKKLDAW